MLSDKRTSLTTVTGSNEQLVEVATRRRYITSRRKNNLLKAVPLLIIFCIIFFTMYLVMQFKYSKLLAEEICTSRDCIESSVTIREAMNTDKDPCQDFYAYACGNFPILNPISEEKQITSWFEKGEAQLNKMMRMVLMNVNKINDSQLVENTRNFFRSCTNTGELERRSLTPLYELLMKLDLPKYPTKETAENFNLGKTLGLIQRHLGEDVLVLVTIARGSVQQSFPNDTFMLQVSPVSNLGTRNGIRTDPSDQSLVSVLPPGKDLLQRIMFMGGVIQHIVLDLNTNHDFKGTTNITAYQTDAVKILSFTESLKQVLMTAVNNLSDVNDTDDNSESMTFQELQEHLDVYSPSEKENNRIIWSEFLVAFFGNDGESYWVYDYSQDKVKIAQMETFKNLASLLGSTSPLKIQRYIWWTIVHMYAKYTTKALRTAYDQFFESLYGVPRPTSRINTCVALTRKALYASLAIPIRNHFKLGKETSKVTEMLENIQDEFGRLVNSLDWMESWTKILTVEKSLAIKSYIGYEDEFLDEDKLTQYYSGLVFHPKELIKNFLRIHEWEVSRVLKLLKQNNITVGAGLNTVSNPLQVNAFYVRELNSIFVPAGILQKPFYYRGLESLNYGAIGSILGHELTHGFDSDGKDYDLNGKLKEDLWSSQESKQYEDRTRCFINQYNQFSLTRRKKLNGTYTLSENIADNGGIRESYYAYQSFVRRNGREPKLPGFEDFSHEQLFFLSYANIWCEGYGEAAIALMMRDNHSPNRVRVLASLQNMNEFSEAFNCPKKSIMNPENKCVLW